MLKDREHKTVILVTSATHMQRAWDMFENKAAMSSPHQLFLRTEAAWNISGIQTSRVGH
jgi:uncharacterized SAM-binding protein YcdF (DUF218 family)